MDGWMGGWVNPTSVISANIVLSICNVMIIITLIRTEKNVAMYFPFLL